jgi:transposase
MSVAETKYQAILAVIADGRTVAEVADQWKVDRRTVHRWLARYEGGGLEGLTERSHRPESCPHQMPAEVEALVLELRRGHRYWGPRRLALALVRKGVDPAPSESAVYRCLVRAAAIDPVKRHRRKDTWKRWERSEPMELWQMDTVGGFLLADGTAAKALTGIDDHRVYAGAPRRGGTAASSARVDPGDRWRRCPPRIMSWAGWDIGSTPPPCARSCR